MMSQVAIAKGGTPQSLVKKVLRLIKVEERIKSETKILIKPNLARVPQGSLLLKEKGAYEQTFFPEGDLVHLEVIEGLLMVLSELKVRNISIGEAAGGSETPLVYKAIGLYELADKYGVELLDLNYADSEKIEVPDGWVLENIWVPKVVLGSDFLINMPVSKVHGWTAVTLSLKNWGLGILPGKYYGINKVGRHKKGLDAPLPMHEVDDRTFEYGQEVASSKVIVDVCSAVKCDLNIVDGLKTVHYVPGARKFLSKGLVENTNMIVAGYDMVATDTVCSRIYGFRPERILHIKWAADKGIGVGDLSKIEVLGETIKDLEMRCNPLAKQIRYIRVDR